MAKLFFILATLLGAVGVALGAFGAHTLESRIEARLLEVFEIGVRYQFYHVFALMAVVVAIDRWPASGLPVIAGWLFVAGIVLFSGSLYVMAFTGIRILGAVTPLGGVAFIGGWLCLALTAWRG